METEEKRDSIVQKIIVSQSTENEDLIKKMFEKQSEGIREIYEKMYSNFSTSKSTTKNKSSEKCGKSLETLLAK